LKSGEVGPIGHHWRVWREECSQAGDLITIRLFRGSRVKIDLGTRRITMEK